MKIIGHRGARGLAPENTLHGFEKALEHHVDEIELDVRLTKDNKTALVHNPYITDIEGNRMDIASHTFRELQQHKPDLTSLEAALALIDQRVPITVEIKPKVDPTPVIAILRHAIEDGWLPTNLHVASFSQTTLIAAHQTLPELTMIVNESWSGVRAHWRARQLETKRIAMRSWWLWGGFLASVKSSGYLISPYTINDPVKARKWQKYLYGIVTDRPDLFEERSSSLRK